MSLKYAIVPYPIPEELIKGKLIAQTQTSAIKNNSMDKCIVSYQIGYNVRFSQYPNFDTASDLILFKSQNPKEWDSEYEEESKVEIDSERRQITRIAAGKKGWTYLAHSIEIMTSTIDGCYSTDYTGTTRTDFDISLYDIDGVKITDQGIADIGCVKTILTFKPLYDYEIVSGNIFQKEATNDNIRLWVIGGLFLEASNTPLSVKEFISGVNFKFVGNDDHIETDGRASKMMTKDLASKGYAYPTFQGNCFQFIITHPAGTKHDLMTVLEYFRE